MVSDIEPSAQGGAVLDIELRTLEPRIRRVWAIQIGAWALALLAAAFVYDLFRFFGGNEGARPGLLSLVVFVCGVGACLVIPRLRFRFWRYALTAEELYLERGILTLVRTVVPLRRVQHLDVAQSLLEREFGLARLIVHTAGSRSSDVVLPGLRDEEAERLRDEVKRYILEDVE